MSRKSIEAENWDSLCTIAVVTKKGRTMITKSNGAAYFIIELGIFMQGSSSVGIGSMVSLFLFGDAYSKFIGDKSLKEGSVILILCPKVFLSKGGSETSVSFSIRDSDRLVLTGTALDFGICEGKSFRGIKCKKPVDLRRGKYCSCHKNYETEKNTSSKAFQKLKSTHTSLAVKGAP